MPEYQSGVTQAQIHAWTTQHGQERHPLAYPRNHHEWQERYDWLWSAYVGEPYTDEDIRLLRLFKALDENDEIIAETRRLTRDVQHIVDTDAQALAGAELTLDLDVSDEPSADQLADLDLGFAIWQRSRLQREKGRWARMCASMGDVMIEAVRQSGTAPYKTRLVAYAPRHVRLEYDDTGTEVVRAIIEIPYFDGAEISRTGQVLERQVLHTYLRVLDEEEVTVYQDGELVESESGPHRLGRVPLVHLPFVPYVEPTHGLWAATALEHSLALIDSLMTQLQAIGNRYGNPLLVLTGFKIGSGAEVGQVGRVINGAPIGASAEYLESDLGSIRTLLEAAQTEHAAIRQTLPEFLFSESGANSSGSALNFRAAAFVAKMEEIRGRWYAGLAEITEYAVAMEKGQAYDDEAGRYLRVSAPPVLPVNVPDTLKSIHDVLDRGGLLRRDYVSHIQRLGLIPASVDPGEYALEVEAEQEAMAEMETVRGQRLLGTEGAGAGAVEVGGLPATTEEPEQ